MSAISSMAYSAIDLLHPEDTMDLASSPRMPADDPHFELDTMRDASVEPNHEAMIEDPLPFQHHSTEDFQLDDEDLLRDDDMLDEDTVIHNPEANAEDLAMEVHPQTQPDSEIDDDDILYDEEEIPQGNPAEDEQIRDSNIGNEEDLFQGEEIQEHEMEETTGEPQETQTDHGEDVFVDEEHTNIISQDPEDREARNHTEASANLVDKLVADESKESTYYPDDLHHHLADDERVNTLPTSEPTNHGAETIDAETKGVQNALISNEQDIIDQQEKPPAILTVADTTTQEDTEVRGDSLEDALYRHQEIEERADDPVPLHTVKVNYQDNEICLFPPTEDDNSETFFLQDVGLAHQSLDKLLSACREVLAGTIDDDDELVLDVASLGLHISEDSSYATQITLSQILDVYLMLCHNGPGEQAEPLFCTLSSRVSLASQHAYLLSAAQQGKSFAEVLAEHTGSGGDSSEAAEEKQEFHDDNSDNPQQSHLENTEQNYEYEQADLETVKPHQVEQDSPVEALTQQGDQELDQVADYDEAEQHVSDNAPQAGFEVNEEVAGAEDHGENETSATSTVQGDETGSQGEYNPRLQECHTPDLCFCVNCDANYAADFEEVPDDAIEPTTIIRSAINKSNGLTEPHGSTAGAIDDHLDTSSAQGDTGSSHTMGPGDDFVDRTNTHEDLEDYSFIEAPTEVQHDVQTEVLDLPHADLASAAPLSLHDDDTVEKWQKSFDTQTERTDREVISRAAGTTHHKMDIDEDDLLDFEDEHENENEELNGHVQADPLNDGLVEQDHFVQHEDLFDGSKSNGGEHVIETPATSFDEKPTSHDVFDDLSVESKASIHEVTPPATPSGRSSKRKAMDEDDAFDLLDFDTPDTKRRRPS